MLIVLLLFSACNRQSPTKAVKPRPSFEKVTGIPYSEVRRAFDNGLSFDKQGFQLEPDWKMTFLTKDSVRLYNPLEKRFYKFFVHFDHDSVINMARTWLRVKAVSRDSLKFQLLKIEGLTVSAERSNIYMTFYADRYIRNVLHTSTAELRKPRRNDSTFIRGLVKAAGNRPELAFAAREPVDLTSKSTIIKAEKVQPAKDVLNSSWLVDEYMSPEYKILIKPAYKDFNYSFTAVVDADGNWHFGKSTVYIMPEFEVSRIRVMKGIMDVYLRNLLEVRPGKTLGMAHPSTITLNVKGVK